MLSDAERCSAYLIATNATKPAMMMTCTANLNGRRRYTSLHVICGCMIADMQCGDMQQTGL